MRCSRRYGTTKPSVSAVKTVFPFSDMSRKIIFLDLDETVLDFKRAEDHSLRKTLTDLDVPVNDEIVALYSAINDSCWKKLEKGEMTREQILSGRFSMLYESLGVERDPELTWSIYENNISNCGFLLDGAIELLKELSEDYELYGASNGTATIQDKRIEASGIAPYFKEIFISQRIGYNKPDKRFFDICFEKAGVSDLKECVMIGDSLTSDIKGGKNAGITTVWYNPKGKEPSPDILPDYQASSLDMIPLVLEMIYN